MMPATIDDSGEFLADIRALEAAGAEMVELEGDGPEQWILLGAIAAVTERLKLRLSSVDPGAVLQKLSRGRAFIGSPAGEKWMSISMPADRDSWAAALHDCEAAGATGVVVSWDRRLIDLLRNPEPDDRSDLLISTG